MIIPRTVLRGRSLALALGVAALTAAVGSAAQETAAEGAAAEGAAAEGAAAEGTPAEGAAGEGTGEITTWEEVPYVQKDGAFDFGVYNGYRRYHASCHVCHGPDALGSSFAPALAESLKTLSYADFLEVVVNGREAVRAGQQSVMPAFGNDENVMLYIDHIYAYLKARADGVLDRGRPERLPPEEDPVWQQYQEQQG